MTSADNVIRQITVNHDLRAALDDGLNLRLPLLGAGSATLGQELQDAFRRIHLVQQFLKRAVCRHTITALAGDQDQSTFLHNASRRGHALHTLVKILIERVAAVGGYHDVKGLVHRLHGRLRYRHATAAMGLLQIPRIHTGNGARIVQRDVDQETGSRQLRDPQQLLPQWVPMRDAKGRIGVTDIVKSMIAHH